MKRLLAIVFVFIIPAAQAENGYDLWMRYKPVENKLLLTAYQSLLKQVSIKGNSETIRVLKEELMKASEGMLQQPVTFTTANSTSRLLIGTRINPDTKPISSQDNISSIGDEGFIIYTNNNTQTVITANTDIGLLYGVFHLLRLMQTQQSVTQLHIVSAPRIKLRLLNHWDNLNRTVERGYAGFSIWNWHVLPGYIDQRYIDYARANASIGINGTVLTNVNANATFLTRAYLEKVKALADVFRPYGIKVYLTARFSAPIEIGGLKTADPLNAEVRQWWTNKINEIYALIPDFGGFTVKANSEGQPGPQDYQRTHADGANMLADAIAPHKGIIMWRAFVYSHEVPDDRHKQAWNEFVPLDGKFSSNVLVQVKNGAIDFMPREPFHPLFGAMPNTPLMMEFQLTQEYLGQGTHLVYLAPLFKEVLNSDTYSKGKGSTVAKVIDGSLDNHTISGMAGVSNIGTDIDWTGHPFAQANWYALGRLSWDYNLSAEQIAEEWLRMTFSNDAAFVSDAKKMMLASREILVQYMNPLGLHHIMATGHHYGPGPWISNLSRPEWNPTYYHRADSAGIGFDRTATGSKALAQYKPEAAKTWADVNTIDEKYLLWFHHVAWTHTMKSGRNLWEELCYQYNSGVDSVRWMQQLWRKQKTKVDDQRYRQISMLLNIQEQEAIWWRNACLLYFETFSKMPVPANYEKPDHDLKYYEGLSFPNAPGN
ncbi:MAG: alpha-glucuronidase [Ferruginibacter sp.]|uniref:alpha-glucuronidase family glycosyl hydrolase n=1 Tax=Ferruginibacter sp. TaxID=1940288 RepID=UPI002658FBE2|nr:alpha-glucuronidase family glycosyl hydrolase [Ferruginibacter sp.]MDB5277383.1 alpha-glucuronidase [Ferruginibacter sp.]